MEKKSGSNTQSSETRKCTVTCQKGPVSLVWSQQADKMTVHFQALLIYLKKEVWGKKSGLGALERSASWE